MQPDFLPNLCCSTHNENRVVLGLLQPEFYSFWKDDIRGIRDIRGQSGLNVIKMDHEYGILIGVEMTFKFQMTFLYHASSL